MQKVGRHIIGIWHMIGKHMIGPPTFKSGWDIAHLTRPVLTPMTPKSECILYNIALRIIVLSSEGILPPFDPLCLHI